MASVNLSGVLLNPEGFPDVGAIVKFTLLTNTGDTVKSSVSELIVPPDGAYSVDIVYGNLRVDYISDFKERFVAIVTVNNETTATSLPELLNAAVPPTNAQLLQFQAILADAVTAKNAAELAETGAVAAEATLLAEKLTIVELTALSNSFPVGTVIKTLGDSAAGVGGESQWVKTSGTGTISQSPTVRGNGTLTDADGSIYKLFSGCANFNIVANVPSDFATMQDAIDFYYGKVTPASDYTISINIESGHQPASNIAVSNGDYSKFVITSDDAEVTLAPSFNPNTSVINCINAKSPVLNTLFDCNGIIDTAAFNLTGGSTGFVNPNKGMKNGNNRGLHVQNSSNCYADYAVFTGFGQAGVHSSRDGTVQCSYADVSGCSQDPANSFGALYASRGSLIHGADIDVSNSGGDGVRAQRQATIVCAGVNVSGCEKIAFVANGGNISCDSSPPIMTAIKGQAVVVQSGGQIHMGINTITFAAGMTDKAIDCENGRVIAKGITMSGYEGIGVYGLGANSLIDVSDITLSGGTYGLWALDNANINAEYCSITGASAIGVNCVSGAKISVEDGTVTGSGSLDINLAKGAWVTATNCTTTAGVGTPAIADTNMSAGFNFSNNGSKGFIWV